MANLLALKLHLYNIIRSMYDEGCVNEQFLHLQAMRLPFRRDAVVRIITSYYISCKNLFISLTHQLDQQTVDYEQVNNLAQDFYAKTSSIGAESVRCACAQLILASERRDKNACSLALYWTKNRFSYLRTKFETLVQGAVNDQLSQIYSLENAWKPDCSVQPIKTHFVDVDVILSELSHNVDIPKVDFCKLGSLALEMEKKSLRQLTLSIYRSYAGWYDRTELRTILL